MPDVTNARSRRLIVIIHVVAFVGGIVGVLVLTGWAFNIPTLKSVVPEFIAMQPWTATCFILSSCALVMAAADARSVRLASMLPAAAVAMAAGSALLQYLTRRDFGTDIWLFPDAVRVAQTHAYPNPGRMSQSAAIGLTALAIALLLAPHAHGRPARIAFMVFATIPLAASVLALTAYLLQLEPLNAMFWHNPLALHAALTLAALSVGTLVLRPDIGWIRLTAEQGSGGWMSVVLLGLGALFVAFGNDAATRSGTIAAQASEASRRLEVMLSIVKDAETGQRGRLLTNTESYLQPYEAARLSLPGALAQVGESLSAILEDDTRFRRLRGTVDNRMAELADTIAFHRAGQNTEALRIVGTGRGNDLMDQIRQEVRSLQQIVVDLAAARSQYAHHIALLAAAGIAGLAGLAFWVLSSAARAQKSAAAALAVSGARQQNLLATLGLGTFMATDVDDNIQFWADGCTRLYGWTATEAIGRSARDLLGTVFPRPWPEIEAELQRNSEWKGDLRQRTREGREVVVTAHKVVHRSPAGERDVMLEALMDVTAQRRAEAALHDSQTLLRTVIETTPGLIFAKDSQGRMLMANNAALGLIGKPWTEVAGRTDKEFLGDPAQGENVMMNDREVMASGQTQKLEEVVNEATGQPRVFLSTKTPMRNADNAIIGLVGVSVDITERKRDEERLRLMVNELNHRVKNTLATVQGIATQTLHDADLAARRKFEGRLLALATVHDVLTRESWAEAYLHDIIESALTPHGGLDNPRFKVSGPPIRVQPRVAVAFSLAFHELATNAVKYGALSGIMGEVAVRWIITDEAEPCLRMTWMERGGPPVVAPKRRGFGTRLIERSLAQDLGGSARLVFDANGLVCTIDTSLKEVAAGGNVIRLSSARRVTGNER